MFSPDVLNFLAVILSQQSVSAADPHFEQRAALISKARRELLAALEVVDPHPGEPAVERQDRGG